jgi:hypothetical protein
MNNVILTYITKAGYSAADFNGKLLLHHIRREARNVRLNADRIQADGSFRLSYLWGTVGAEPRKGTEGRITTIYQLNQGEVDGMRKATQTEEHDWIISRRS